MKIRNITQYPGVIRNWGFFKLLRFTINLPYLFIKRLFSRYIERSVNNYRLILDLHDQGISKELFLMGTREKEHILFLNEILKEGMVVLDLGANIGYYSVMLAKMVGEKGKVYAVEPSLSNFRMLSMNVELNKVDNVVEVENIGISDKTGEANFYLSDKSNWHTFYPKVSESGSHESLTEVTPISVPVTTIKDFSIGRRPIEVIRMDIEGFEVEVLNSLISILKPNQFMPKIIFEVHQPRYNDTDHNMEKVLKEFFRLGYYVRKMASNIQNKKETRIFREKGYKPVDLIRSDGLLREIFDDISNSDAIEFMCQTELVRTVVLDSRNKE